MTILFGKKNYDILPPKQSYTVGGLAILSSLEKLSIVEEANNLGSRKARNWDSLDLSDSIYSKED